LIFHYQVVQEIEFSLNRLVEDLDKARPGFKKTLYLLYKRASEILQQVSTMKSLNEQYKQLLFDTLNQLDLQWIQTWLLGLEEFRIPDTISQEFDERMVLNGEGTREQTYIREEYIQICALGMVMRVLMPMLQEYLHHVAANVYNRVRDLHLLRMIQSHKFFRHSEMGQGSASPVMDKLYAYIHKTLETQLSSSGQYTQRIIAPLISEGIDMDTMPQWILASFLIRKLPATSIICDKDGINPVVQLHREMKSAISTSTSNNKLTQDRHTAEDSGDEEDKASMIERYNRVISTLTPGNIEELNWYYENVEAIVEKYYSFLDQSLLNDCMQSVQKLNQVSIQVVQIHIASWVLKHSIDPRAMRYLRKPVLIRLIGLAQALIWDLGHKQMALAVSAKGIEQEDVIALGVEDSLPKVQLSKHIPTLKELFPYRRKIVSAKPSKFNLSPNEDDTDMDNYTYPILKTVNEMAKRFNQVTWVFTAKEPYLIEAFGHPRYYMPRSANIKPQLAEVIISAQTTLADKISQTKTTVV
jgi:hypothetical protein